MSWGKFPIRLLLFWISPIQRTTLFIPLEGTFTVLYHGIHVLYCTNKVLYHLCHISYIIHFAICIIISTCRTTATCAADVGMSSLQLQQHMGWKSHNMCAEYISNSKQALNEVGSMLAGSSSSQPRAALTPPNKKAAPTNVIAGPSGEVVITRKENNVDDDIFGDEFENEIFQIEEKVEKEQLPKGSFPAASKVVVVNGDNVTINM